MNRAVLFFRQLLYPKEFRIQLPGSFGPEFSTSEFFNGLAEGLAGAQNRIEELKQLLKQFEGTAHEGVPKAFAIDLANQWFRIKRNLSVLEETGTSNKETRMLNRSIEGIQRSMAEQEVELIDFTGKVLVDGQKDFEIAGEPEHRSDIKEKTILFCERPAIMINGKLVQAARGLVAVPAS